MHRHPERKQCCPGGLVLGETDLTHSDLLRGHIQYVGRSLKVNGSFCRNAYKTTSGKLL